MNTSDTYETAVVRPSRLVRVVMRPLTKVLNPATMTMAGRRHVRMAAQVRHVGRKSGRSYVTPVGTGRAGDTFVIPLTFGNQSDWSRNVRAAGGCVVRLDGELLSQDGRDRGRDRADDHRWRVRPHGAGRPAFNSRAGRGCRSKPGVYAA
jgi:deazaflavin-dependent oxidoreductase (nitroreductase family)